MSVEQIISSLASLSPAEQAEIAAFLFHLRHVSDPEFQSRVETRLSDTDTTHWLSPEEFGRQLDRR